VSAYGIPIARMLGYNRAKTSVLVPELNRFYIAVSGKGKADAKMALQIYDVLP
jgi:hypothetical protein